MSSKGDIFYLVVSGEGSNQGRGREKGVSRVRKITKTVGFYKGAIATVFESSIAHQAKLAKIDDKAINEPRKYGDMMQELINKEV